MSRYFFDTRAIGKHYHAELGTAKVDALLTVAGAEQLISRLSVIERHSAFAKKVRTGHLSPAGFDTTTRRFRADMRAKRLRVVRVSAPHFLSAERLIRRVGAAQNLRTLDALQLAVALSLHDPARSVEFVCADQTLCLLASAEGLTVVNPEVP